MSLDAHAIDGAPDSFGGTDPVSLPLATGVEPELGARAIGAFLTTSLSCLTTHGAYWATTDDGFVRMRPTPGMMKGIARRLDRLDGIGASRMRGGRDVYDEV